MRRSRWPLVVLCLLWPVLAWSQPRPATGVHVAAPLAVVCDFTVTSVVWSDFVTRVESGSADDDVVCVGPGTWVATVHAQITKGITIRGLNNCSVDAKGRATSCTTIIEDNINTDSGTINFNPNWTAGKTARVTNIEFRHNASATLAAGSKINGIVSFYGVGYAGRQARVDHCYFNNPIHVNYGGSFVSYHDGIGVADHNTMYTSSASTHIFFEGYHGTYGSATHGDGAWSAAADFGTANFFFIENNTMSRPNGFYAVTDGFRGARNVIRYNDIENSWVEAHGTESTGRDRGTRAIEVYNNVFTCTGTCTSGYIINSRSATAVVHDNTIVGYGAGGATPPGLALGIYRMIVPFVFKQADGRSALDLNGATNQEGGTRTATGGTQGTLVRTGAGWTMNQWVGYTVRKTSTCVHYRDQCASIILSNTSDTLTYDGTGGFAITPLSFTNGETYEINEVTTAFDAPGRGQGTALVAKALRSSSSCINSSGTTAVCVTASNHGFMSGQRILIGETSIAGYTGDYIITVDSPTQFRYTMELSGLATANDGDATFLPASNDQVTEPNYEWANCQGGTGDSCSGGTNVNFGGSYSRQIQAGVHYFTDDRRLSGYVPYTYPHPLSTTP